MNSFKTATGGPVQLTSDGGMKFSPQFISRGEEIVFTVLLASKLLRLMKVKVSDRVVEPLHKAAATHSELDPSVSADGRTISFVQLRGVLSLALVIRDIQTGKDVEVPPAPGFAGMRSPAVAPDGSRVVYSFAEGIHQHLWSVDARAGDRKAITDGPGINNWPNFSPDGKRLAFSSSRNGDFDVYVMPAAGGPATRLTNTPLQDVRPRFSPDGRRIAFTSHRDGTARVYVMNADGSGVKRVETGSERDDFPSWHPDGQKLVLVSEVRGRHDLYLVEAPPP